MQPVVQPVIKPVWQPTGSEKLIAIKTHHAKHNSM